MNNLNDMTDLSFTQTSRAMSSLPLNRAERVYKPWWQVVSEYNKQTLTLTKAERVRVTKCKNPAVFTSL